LRFKVAVVEILGHAHVEATGVLQLCAQHVVDAGPVMLVAVLAADDQHLEPLLRRVDRDRDALDRSGGR
jgi:hypothetical protein